MLKTLGRFLQERSDNAVETLVSLIEPNYDSRFKWSCRHIIDFYSPADL